MPVAQIIRTPRTAFKNSMILILSPFKVQKGVSFVGKKLKQYISKLFGAKHTSLSFAIKILVIFAICFIIIFYIAVRLQRTDRDNMFDSFMATSAVVIPVVLAIRQVNSEKEKEKNEKRNTEIFERIRDAVSKNLGNLVSVIREKNVLALVISSSDLNSQHISSPAHQSSHLSARSNDMPKLATFILCEDIIATTNDNEESRTCLAGPKASLSLSHIPGKCSFGIGVGLVNVNWSRDRKIEFEIWSPSGTCVQKSEIIEIPDEYANTAVPVAQQTISLNIKVKNMNAPEEGNYKFVLFINDERVGEKSFPILQA